MIKVRELFREAWRNTDRGVTRPLLAALLFMVMIGGFSIAQILGIVQIGKDAQEWRTVGASTQIVNYPQGIDGARCDALLSVTGVVAAGAVRKGENVTLAALPSNTFQTFEATPGFASLLGSISVSGTIFSDEVPGVWLSDDLADALGVAPGHPRPLPIISSDGTASADLTVSAVYPYPGDGRLPILVHNMILPVPAVGVFDACWVEIWPESATLDGLLTTATIITGQNAGGDPPRVEQLNTSFGAVFDAPGRLERLPGWMFNGAALLTGMVIGWVLVWSRRLELASTLHAGVNKTSLILQLLIETVLWVAPSTALITAGGYYVATLDNPEPPWPALAPGLIVCSLGLVATLISTIIIGLSLNENRFFKFFKGRR